MFSGIALTQCAVVGPGGSQESFRLNGVVHVDLCTWAMYNYVSGYNYWSH